jgi:hypothetical protein
MRQVGMNNIALIVKTGFFHNAAGIGIGNQRETNHIIKPQDFGRDFNAGTCDLRCQSTQRVMQKCHMVHYKDEIARGVPCSFYRIKNR